MKIILFILGLVVFGSRLTALIEAEKISWDVYLAEKTRISKKMTSVKAQQQDTQEHLDGLMAIKNVDSDDDFGFASQFAESGNLDEDEEMKDSSQTLVC